MTEKDFPDDLGLEELDLSELDDFLSDIPEPGPVDDLDELLSDIPEPEPPENLDELLSGFD